MGPKRVVSLLPSATEVVALAGGAEVLVGRSHECDHPASVRGLPMLTAANNDFQSSAQMNDAVTSSLEAGQGLYRLDAQLLRELKPDVIVTQDLCAVCAVDLSAVQRACDGSAKIICLNPFTLEDVLEDVIRTGKAMATEERAAYEVAALRERIAAITSLASRCSTVASERPKARAPILLPSCYVAIVVPAGRTMPGILTSITDRQHLLKGDIAWLLHALLASLYSTASVAFKLWFVSQQPEYTCLPYQKSLTGPALHLVICGPEWDAFSSHTYLLLQHHDVGRVYFFVTTSGRERSELPSE